MTLQRTALRLTACIVALAAVRCTGRTEQPLLSRFFTASRLRDKTALKDIATVVFEPADQGMVTDFVITAVSPEEHDGSTVSERVTLSAPVSDMSGTIVQKTLLVVLQRRAGQWIITGVVASPASPRP